MSRNNENLKRITAALGMDKHDIVEAMHGAVSKSRADSWLRSPDSVKSASGNSNATTVKRYRAMEDAEFDAFCAGLDKWLSMQGNEND